VGIVRILKKLGKPAGFDVNPYAAITYLKQIISHAVGLTWPIPMVE